MKQKLQKAKKPKQIQKNKLLFIGLGNPGDKYRETRHNAGFAVIDHLAAKYDLKLRKPFLKQYLFGRIEKESHLIFLIKPLTFMNRSGDIIDSILHRTGAAADDIVLICDNMDLKPGMIRLKNKGSSAGHNGIKSVIENIGSPDFKRLYIGVGRPSAGEGIIEHVLGCFEPGDLEAFEASVEDASDSLMLLGEKPVNQVMNEINKRNN